MNLYYAVETYLSKGQHLMFNCCQLVDAIRPLCRVVGESAQLTDCDCLTSPRVDLIWLLGSTRVDLMLVWFGL